MTVPPPSFAHLFWMSNRIGTFEHADHTEPRLSHGYCTDDMARLLVVIAREPQPSQELVHLGRTAFRFLVDAQGVTGEVRNRRSADGRWEDRRSVADCWGRSAWAFGVAARWAPETWMRQSALAHFHHGVEPRSPWPRAMAFAALGAAEVLVVDPHHARARQVLADAVTTIGCPGPDPDWPWPEGRLTYANAVLAEALLAAGSLLERPEVVADGLRMLGWLLQRETRDGHLSLTPVGGSGPGEGGPGFDQQPIEAATMADACVRAAAVTGDAAWLDGLERSIRWFAGDNDAGAVMWDPDTGGGYDGLHATGPNLNQGAESTIALVSSLQHARLLHAVPL